MQNGRPVPNGNELSLYAANKAGEMDVIYQPIYDFQTYAAAGQSSLTFFQSPQGQNGKTLEDTNMQSAGQMPNPQKFVVKAISVDFFAGNDVNLSAADGVMNNWQDTYDFFKSGWLDFSVGNKSQCQQAPIGTFPPPYRLGGSSAVTGQSGTANGITGADYASMAGQMFNIIPVVLPANQNFVVTLNWSTPVAINADAKVGVKLHGDLYRSVQ